MIVTGCIPYMGNLGLKKWRSEKYLGECSRALPNIFYGYFALFFTKTTDNALAISNMAKSNLATHCLFLF